MNKIYLMDLDVCIHDGHHVLIALQTALKENNLFAHLNEEYGPAGGNSNWHIIGTKENLKNLLISWYLKEDLTDVDYYMSLVQEYKL